MQWIWMKQSCEENSSLLARSQGASSCMATSVDSLQPPQFSFTPVCMNTQSPTKNSVIWAWHYSVAAKVLTLNAPGSHMGTSCNPGSSASHPAPCLWPGKAIEDGPKPWDPAPEWETWKSLLALDWLSSSYCGHLESESSDGRSSSLFLLLSVYLTL